MGKRLQNNPDKSLSDSSFPLSFVMPSTEADSSASESAAEKITVLKAAAAKKVLPKRSTRGQRSSKSSASTDAADESLISNASSQGSFEPTEAQYLWGCELTRKNSSYVLPFPGDADPDHENQEHTLTIKSATLGIDAEEKERNVVEIRYFDREDKESRNVLASLTLGVQDFCRLDLRISHMFGREVSLKLIKGSGPISIIGNHLVETFSAVTDEDFEPDASSADASSDASGMETEGDEVEADEVKDITEDAEKEKKEEEKEKEKENTDKAKKPRRSK